MVAHKITANDEHAAWPIHLGFEGVDPDAVPAALAIPAGTTITCISRRWKDEKGNQLATLGPKKTALIAEADIDHAARDVTRKFTEGAFTNADQGVHRMQWRLQYPDGTSETWPAPDQYDELTVGFDLGEGT